MQAMKSPTFPCCVVTTVTVSNVSVGAKGFVRKTVIQATPSLLYVYLSVCARFKVFIYLPTVSEGKASRQLNT